MRKHPITRFLGIAVIPVLVAACRDSGPIPDGWLTAHIVGAVQTEFEGTGYFSAGSGPPGGVSVRFGLGSRGTGASTGQRFSLDRPGNGRPGTGRYTLAPLEPDEDGNLVGFTAYYYRTADSVSEGYTASSGEVEITRSSGDVVEGEFRFSGVLYSYSSADSVWYTGPNTLDPGAPTIEVTGSFGAVPLDRLRVIDQHVTVVERR